MRITLAEIIKIAGGEVVGDASTVITGISGIKEARPGDLTFLANPKYVTAAKKTEASAILVGRGVLVEGKTVIQTDNPSLAFSKVIDLAKDAVPRPKGIHPTAVVAVSAVIGEGVALGPHVVVEDHVKIGKNTVICAGTYIGYKASVGENTFIYPNVTVREEVIIGSNVIIHSSSVIGSDGFGYIQMGDEHMKVPQLGNVVIEDNVEIGACVTIDRARFDRTLIGKGTKIDNLVQIAHNVHVGENALIIALAGIAGSASIGKNAIIAGQVGVAGHVTVGDRAVVAAQSGITKNVDAGAMMFGTPAEEYSISARMMSHMKRLPRYAEEIKELRAEMDQLKKMLGKVDEAKNNS